MKNAKKKKINGRRKATPPNLSEIISFNDIAEEPLRVNEIRRSAHAKKSPTAKRL